MTDAPPRVLFYVLHLLGVGHVYRAQRLIEGFAVRGIAVDVIYGGTPIDGITFDAESVHYLPPISAADSTYASYVDADGQPLADAFLTRRQGRLLEIFGSLQPDLILMEAFPFGRRMVRRELAALIEQAARRTRPPLIVSSVRDILQERKKPGRVEETRDWILSSFDHVLVHCDPKIIDLQATYPLAAEIERKLTYTGFVVPPLSTLAEPESFDVVVSAGGGAFGAELMQAALKAVRLLPKDLRWCLAAGANADQGDVLRLRKNAPENVVVRDRLENLCAHMKLARISISQCGYNTAMDVLAAHRDSPCRAVFVPYDTRGQSEQLRRAQLLEQAGYAINLPQSRLTPKRLAGAVEKASRLGQVMHRVNLDGVANSARIVRNWLDERAR